MKKFEEFINRCYLKPKKTVLVVCADDLDVLKVTKKCEKAKIAEVILIGDKSRKGISFFFCIRLVANLVSTEFRFALRS